MAGRWQLHGESRDPMREVTQNCHELSGIFTSPRAPTARNRTTFHTPSRRYTMRSNLLASAIAIGLGIAAVAPAHAADDTATQLAAMKAQIAALQAQVEELQAQNDAQS